MKHEWNFAQFDPYIEYFWRRISFWLVYGLQTFMSHIYIFIGGLIISFLLYEMPPGPAIEWRIHDCVPYYDLLPKGPFAFTTLLVITLFFLFYQRLFASLWVQYGYNKYAGWWLFFGTLVVLLVAHQCFQILYLNATLPLTNGSINHNFLHLSTITYNVEICKGPVFVAVRVFTDTERLQLILHILEQIFGGNIPTLVLDTCLTLTTGMTDPNAVIKTILKTAEVYQSLQNSAVDGGVFSTISSYLWSWNTWVFASTIFLCVFW